VACSNPSFQPDFFNNVAAVAIVLIFAKVVVHRMRQRESRAVRQSGRRNRIHVFAVLAASVAGGASLWATERQSDWCLFHWCAWIGLALASVIFVIEIIHDDVCAASGPEEVAQAN
jgi:uncharacterized membrane protein YoaT (DUF817 family)